MRRVFATQVTGLWAAAAAISLFLGWLSGYWTLGAGMALTGLCMMAIGPPRTFAAAVIASFARSRKAVLGATPSEAAAPNDEAFTVEPEEWQADDSLVLQMIRRGRVALLLRPQVAHELSAEDLQAAQASLDEEMAIVPDGQVAMRPLCFESLDRDAAERCERLVHVEGLFLDRCAVSNRQYREFVDAGGYEQMSLWDEAIWPAVLTFVDRTGQPGPRFWSDGTFPPGQGDHPIVGVCWHEACAYARWAGKRLPTDAEWVKAASWPVLVDRDRPLQRRFPWGDSMDRRLANIWGSGHDATIAVDALPAGASASGALQLVGNVWEWTSTSFGAWEPAARKIETDAPLKGIRGGAFDTYFETQVHAQFQSGAHPLDRKHNIGFRCALGFCDVVSTAADAKTAARIGTPEPELEEVSA